MFSSLAIEQIKDILSRLSKGEKVTLAERVFIKNAADKDQRVTAWLTKAKRVQKNHKLKDSLDQLINELDLGSAEPDDYVNSNPEDLGNWFLGAPSWVARS